MKPANEKMFRGLSKTPPGSTLVTDQEPEARVRESDEGSGAPDSCASLADFVIGEVRDHLRDIHLEISALRANLDAHQHLAGNRRSERDKEFVPTSHHSNFELVNFDNEAPQRLTAVAQIEDPTGQIEDLPAPLQENKGSVDTTTEVDAEDLMLADVTSPRTRASTRASARRTSVISHVGSLSSSVRSVDVSESTSKYAKKERLAGLYRLRLRKSQKLPRNLRNLQLSYRSLVECVMKKRLSTRRLETFMTRPQVQAFVLVCVFLNSLYMGMSSSWYVRGSLEEYHRESNVSLRAYDAPAWTVFADFLFSTVFLVEVLLRMLGQECRFFFGEDWQWNLFDFVIEMLSLVDMLLMTTSSSHVFFRTLRLLKVARAFRTIRMLRHVPWMHELRFMTLAIFNSVVPLFWACVVIVIFLFVISIVLVQGVALYIFDAPDPSNEIYSMEERFGSLEGTMLTLFMSMTGGIDWSDAFEVLTRIHWLYGLLFTLFIACSALAVLNIITSIFVTDAIEVAHMDVDLRMRAQIGNSRKAVKELTDIFREMDVAQQNTITSDMLEKAVRNDTVRAQFALLGLEITDAVSFFRVLDVDGGGEVDASEFVMGCLRLKGHTNLIDVEVDISEIKKMLRTALSEQRRLGKHVSMLHPVPQLGDS